MNANLVRTAGESRMFQALVVLDRYPGVAITSLVRISGGGIDSFLGFEYCDVITLVSREFRVLLTILPMSLRCLRIFGFVRVAWCCDPTFLAYPHGLLS